MATLRIKGDDLDPERITALLGAVPTEAFRKGDVVRGKKTGQEVTKKTGMWRLVAQDRSPADINAQIDELLGQLTHDLATWTRIREHCTLDPFCGLFMKEGNEGIEISPDRLVALGQRGVELMFDIYDGGDE